MVAKQSSSSLLKTEGQVMAERPKKNRCFATPGHPWKETPLLSCFATVLRARLRKLGYHNRVVVRPRRFFFELFQDMRIGARQLLQAVHRQAVENPLEHWQNGKEQDGGHHAAKQSVTHLRKDRLKIQLLQRRLL